MDNCSTDGTQEYVRRAFPDAVFVQNDSNAGFGAANNIGIKYALSHGYRYVYLLNQDAWVDKDCIGSMIDSLGDGYGLLSPVQTDARGNLDRNFERKCGKFLARHNDSPVVRVPFVMAAHWLVPTETFRIVGGFSPVFTQYGEDDNFIDRLHYHGLKCGVVRTATAGHDRPAVIERKAYATQVRLGRREIVKSVRLFYVSMSYTSFQASRNVRKKQVLGASEIF